MRMFLGLAVTFAMLAPAWAQDGVAEAAEAVVSVEAVEEKVAEPPADPQPKPSDAAEAQPDDNAAQEEAKGPKPLSDEEVALVVEDELDAVLLQWQSLNKSANVNLMTGQVSRNMSFSAQLILPNDTKVAGIGSQMFFTQMLNEDGEEITPNRMDIVKAFGQGDRQVNLPRTSYYPPQRDSGQPSPYRHVSGSVSNMEIDAKSFKKLSGFVPIRIAAQSLEFKIDNTKTTEWKDLAGGLRYMVHEVRDSGSYHETMVYFMRKNQPPNQAMDMNRAPSVMSMQILDAEAQPFPDYSTSNSTTSITHNGQRQYVYYMRRRVRKVPGRTPATVHLQVALRVVEAPVMFEFEDVPLP